MVVGGREVDRAESLGLESLLISGARDLTGKERFPADLDLPLIAGGLGSGGKVPLDPIGPGPVKNDGPEGAVFF